MSFGNAFRRGNLTRHVTPVTNNVRRSTSFFGQALQVTVAQLQSQSTISSNSETVFDGSIKFRCYLDIKEQNKDQKGNVNFTSVSRSF
jgi:hypothetical protein